MYLDLSSRSKTVPKRVLTIQAVGAVGGGGGGGGRFPLFPVSAAITA